MSLTCLGGTLVRLGKDCWRWVDGYPAPEVLDLTINAHNFRVSGGLVEVRSRVAQDPYNAELAWVLEGQYRRQRGIIFVPLADWDAHAVEPIGCTWPAEIEHMVLDRAQDLGWEWSGKRVASVSG